MVLEGELRVGRVEETGPFMPGIILEKDILWDGDLMKAGSVVLLDPRSYIVAEMYNPQDHVEEFTDSEFVQWVREHPNYPKYDVK